MRRKVEVSLRIADNARRSLLSGTTTIRTTDDPSHADLALKKAIELGFAEGPRIHSSGEMVDITAGHWRRPSYPGRSISDYPGGTGRSLGRSFLDQDCDFGWNCHPGGGIAAALMNRDEIEAVVDTAHRMGVKVTAPLRLANRHPGCSGVRHRLY